MPEKEQLDIADTRKKLQALEDICSLDSIIKDVAYKALTELEAARKVMCKGCWEDSIKMADLTNDLNASRAEVERLRGEVKASRKKLDGNLVAFELLRDRIRELEG